MDIAAARPPRPAPTIATWSREFEAIVEVEVPVSILGRFGRPGQKNEELLMRRRGMGITIR
jgi:hypothetical protein